MEFFQVMFYDTSSLGVSMGHVPMVGMPTLYPWKLLHKFFYFFIFLFSYHLLFLEDDEINICAQIES